jgi:hypothetical protein
MYREKLYRYSQLKLMTLYRKQGFKTIVKRKRAGKKKNRGMYCTRGFVIKLVRPTGDAKNLNGSSVPKF